MFVAGFLGSPPMNFLKLTVGRDADQMVLSSKTVRVTAPPEWTSQISLNGAAKDVVLGIRPENFRVSMTPSESAIQGEVFVIEDLGNELLLDLREDGQPVVARI